MTSWRRFVFGYFALIIKSSKILCRTEGDIENPFDVISMPYALRFCETEFGVCETRLKNELELMTPACSQISTPLAAHGGRARIEREPGSRFMSGFYCAS